MSLSVVVYMTDAEGAGISFVLGVMACVLVILMVAGNEEKLSRTRIMNILAKYTMPIFLMHTLFAALVRTVLMMIGVTNAVVHVIVGLAVGFIGPIVTAVVMKKLKYLEFLLYPGKFIKCR